MSLVPRALSIRAAWAVWVIVLLASPTTGQSQVVLAQDFESGLGGWTVTGNNPFGTPKLLWHLAPSGECGAVSAMGAFNRAPAACDHGLATFGALFSPVFTLPEADSFILRFAYARDMDPLDATTVLIGNPSLGYTLLASDLENASSPTAFSIESHALAELIGAEVRLGFDAMDLIGDAGFGWMIDDIVLRTGAWTDVGGAQAGSQGTPSLLGSGPLEPGSGNALDVANALPSAPAVLVAGLSALNAPFKGGVLVPVPMVLIALTTSGAGTLHLSFTWPSASPADTTVYVQCWISDAGASAGFAASNGLKGVASP